MTAPAIVLVNVLTPTMVCASAVNTPAVVAFAARIVTSVPVSELTDTVEPLDVNERFVPAGEGALTTM